MGMVYRDILRESDGPVATITINRPERRNACRFPTLDELRDAVERCGGDPAIRAVIVTGAGRQGILGGCRPQGDCASSGGCARRRRYPQVDPPVAHHRDASQTRDRRRVRLRARWRNGAGDRLPHPHRRGIGPVRAQRDPERPHPGGRRHRAISAPDRRRTGAVPPAHRRADPGRAGARPSAWYRGSCPTTDCFRRAWTWRSISRASRRWRSTRSSAPSCTDAMPRWTPRLPWSGRSAKSCETASTIGKDWPPSSRNGMPRYGRDRPRPADPE